MIETAWRLGGLLQYEGLNLRRWAHMLAFRGHFMTKSRAYSVTFTALRAERRIWRLRNDLDRAGHDHGHQRLASRPHRPPRTRRTRTRPGRRRAQPLPAADHPDEEEGSMSSTTERLWGPKDVAEYLGIPVQTIYQWRTRGYGPPGRRVGKHVRFLPDDVRTWVKSLKTDAA